MLQSMLLLTVYCLYTEAKRRKHEEEQPSRDYSALFHVRFYISLLLFHYSETVHQKYSPEASPHKPNHVFS